MDFQKPSIEAIKDNLNAKYANKVPEFFLSQGTVTKSIVGNTENWSVYFRFRRAQRLGGSDWPWDWYCKRQWYDTETNKTWTGFQTGVLAHVRQWISA